MYLKDILSNIMTKDQNMGDKGEYFIRSLYFDSVDNIDYCTKMAGTENRKKIRLRIYSTDADKVKLEIKNRYSAYMLKQSLTMKRDDAERMVDGNYAVLSKYDSVVARKALMEMSNHLYSPKVIVDYEREAFIYPEHNVRITFDKHIRGSTIKRLFDPDIGMVPLIQDELMVLEVKYNQILPHFIKNAISSAGIMNSSVSKYCMAREALG